MTYNDTEVNSIILNAKSIRTSKENKPRFHELVSKSELLKSLKISQESLKDTTLSNSVKAVIIKHARKLQEALKTQGHKDKILFDFNPKSV